MKKLINRIRSGVFGGGAKQADPQEPDKIPRSGHNVSRANISPHALKVLYRLKEGGYQAYLVGGGVRDLLLGREPKDFDIATNASPEEVKGLFRNSRLIGRRFRLAHVYFRHEIIEVATFRAAAPERADQVDAHGRLLHDNVYGNMEEDAFRRDFSINALYYDVEDFSVVDYVGGVADLEQGVLRLIGEPEQRYREDPVRMLRAVRFAAKLGFRIHPESETPIATLNHLLGEVPPARLFDEVLKLFQGGAAVQTFECLRHYGLFQPLFPQTEEALAHEDQGFPITFVVRALANTDRRVAEGKPITPAFLFAALLWEPVRRRAALFERGGMPTSVAVQKAAAEITEGQLERIALPRRFSTPMREIWALQSRFHQRGGKRPLRLLEHPRFRAAYDFLCLRAEAGEESQELAQWWTEIQEEDEEARAQRVARGGGPGGGKRRGGKRRRRRRPPRRDSSS